MSVNPSIFRTVFFFLSRLLILGGMILVFSILGSVLGYMLASQLTGIDLLHQPERMNDYNANPSVLAALKILQVCSTMGGFLVSAYYFPKAIREPSYPFLRAHRAGHVGWYGAAIALFLLSIPALSALIHWNENLTLPAAFAAWEEQLRAAENAAQQLSDAFLVADSWSVFLVNILVIAVVPAVTEEFLFRGALLQFAYRCFSNVHVAVWISAIVFSAFHGQFYGFFPRCIMGALLGYLAVYSQSVWPAVCYHFLNNGMAACATFFNWNNSSLEWLHETYIFPLAVTLLSVCATAALVWMMAKKRCAYE